MHYVLYRESISLYIFMGLGEWGKRGRGREEMEEQVEGLGRAFVDHYYYLFDNDRSSLPSLYHSTSMLTFEGHKVQGVDEISQKLNLLPFDQCQHVISTIDSQPSSFTGGIMVFVSGSLKLPGEEHQLRFSQVLIILGTAERKIHQKLISPFLRLQQIYWYGTRT